MDEMDADGVFVLEVLRQMLGAIDRTMLPTGTAESDLQVAETALQEPLHMVVHQFIHRLQECEDLAVFLQKIYHRLIKPRQGFIFLVLTGIMGTAAIEHITPSVSGFINRYALLEREGIDGNTKTAALYDRLRCTTALRAVRPLRCKIAAL